MAILTEKQVWKRATKGKRDRGRLPLDQQENVRRALAFLRAKLGRDELAKVMGMSRENLRFALRRPPFKRMAVLAALVAGVPLESVLSGAWPPPSACPYCGRAD